MMCSGSAAYPIQPLIKGLLVDTETTPAETNNFEFFRAFAEVICLANAHTKDLSYLFNGISPLDGSAALIGIHLVRFLLAARQPFRKMYLPSFRLAGKYIIA